MNRKPNTQTFIVGMNEESDIVVTRETEGMFFEDDGNPVPVEYCDWCQWRMRKRTPATWRSTGDEVDAWCPDHVGHAVNPVELINR